MAAVATVKAVTTAMKGVPPTMTAAMSPAVAAAMTTPSLRRHIGRNHRQTDRSSSRKAIHPGHDAEGQ